MQVVVYTNDLVVGHVGQILDGRGLAGGGWALEDDCIISHSHDGSELLDQGSEGRGQDKVGWVEVTRRVLALTDHELLNVGVAFACLRVKCR